MTKEKALEIFAADFMGSSDLKVVEAIKSITRIIMLENKDTLFNENEKADYFYYVVSGNIKLSKISHDGKEIIIRIVHNNEIFAEAVLYGRNTYPVNSTAINKTYLLAINVSGFKELCFTNQEFILKLFVTMSHQLRYFVDMVNDLTSADTTARLLKYLCNLKEKFPNWQFVALDTNVDWSYAVERESVCGKSYIQTSNEEFMDRTCNNEYGWDSSWKNGSQKAVAYYMDPRNFLSERYIFQFEYLKYSTNLANIYPTSIKIILQGAEFYKYHLNLNNDLSLIFNDVGKIVDTNPVFLAARTLQELGASTTLYNLYSGVYPGFEGYYNFYNYGVSDECATENGVTYCGLKYAKDNNWYGLTEAIKGGANFISSSYINKGQYTTYLQKFNVVPTSASNQFIHQFQTNLAAPSSESSSTYKSYSESNLLNESFVFYIPVYTGMDATINNSSGGATGEKPESNLSDLAINTIVTSSGYKYKNGYILGIAVDNDISTVKGVLESVAGYDNVYIMDKNGNKITSGKVATGMKVKITNKTGSETLQIVIKGDTSGDGIINALDLLQVQKYILGTYTLSGVYKEAGDTSEDGAINALDLLQVQKDILGTYEIVQ